MMELIFKFNQPGHQAFMALTTGMLHITPRQVALTDLPTVPELSWQHLQGLSSVKRRVDSPIATEDPWAEPMLAVPQAATGRQDSLDVCLCSWVAQITAIWDPLQFKRLTLNGQLHLSDKPFQLDIYQQWFPLSPLASNKSPVSCSESTMANPLL